MQEVKVWFEDVNNMGRFDFQNSFFYYSVHKTPCNGMGMGNCGKLLSSVTLYSKKYKVLRQMGGFNSFRYTYCSDCRKLYKESKKTQKRKKLLLSDCYVVGLLKNGSNLSRNDIKLFPELIQAKKMNLKIKRKLTQNN